MSSRTPVGRAMVEGLTEEQERRMRALWKLKADDKISVSHSGLSGRDRSYRSQKTGREIGFKDPMGLYYENPLYHFGMVDGIVLTDRCTDIEGKELCLCVDDLLALEMAIEEVLAKGAENISPEARQLIGKMREKCPLEMRRIRYAMEERPEFNEFMLKGPSISREARELFEFRKKRFPKETPGKIEEWMEKWYRA